MEIDVSDASYQRCWRLMSAKLDKGYAFRLEIDVSIDVNRDDGTPCQVSPSDVLIHEWLIPYWARPFERQHMVDLLGRNLRW